jgi:uncharacterized phage protein gp47/JayE
MPFARPGYSDLQALALNDLAVSPLGLKGLPRFSPSRILAAVIARVAVLHYGYIDWIAQQATPFTCTDEFLEGWAALVGVTRKLAAQATGSASMPGTAGTVINVGTVLRGPDGTEFATTALATIGAGGTATVPVRAALPGAAGNLSDGTGLSLVTPIVGVIGSINASGPITGGADIEEDADLRSRMLVQFAAPPQGGSQTDYQNWALAVPGVSRAWANPSGYGPGTVVVYTMRDTAQAANGGFPQGSNGGATAENRVADATGDQLGVADALYPLRPATALVISAAPVAYPVAFTVSNFAQDTAANRAAVLAALRGVFTAKADPLGGILYPSDFDTAVAAVPGVTRFQLAPNTIVQAPIGSLPVLGTVTWA